MEVLRVGLDEVVKNFTRWGAEWLVGPWSRTGVAAVWGTSNCIITAVVVTPKVTEVDLELCENGPVFSHAVDDWNELLHMSQRVGWISDYKERPYYDDWVDEFLPERTSVSEMLVKYDSNPSLFELQWKANAERELKLHKPEKSYVEHTSDGRLVLVMPLYDDVEEGWKMFLEALDSFRWRYSLCGDKAKVKALAEKSAMRFFERPEVAQRSTDVTLGDGQPNGNAGDGQGKPGTNSAQAKFTLPTTPDRFTTWLENHTQAVNTQVGGWWGGYTLQPARRMVRTDKRNVWRIAAVSEDANIEDAISFEIEDTSPERIKVTAKCIFGVPSPVYKYFFGLLVDIGDERGWSEAREGINRAFGVTDEIPQTTPGAAPDALTSPISGAALGSRKGKEERTIDKPTTGYLEWLRQNIVDHFDEGELRDLCFGMGIDYDDLPGQSKKDKARELVARCKRTSRIRDLVAKLTDLRPKVSWEARPE